MRIILKPNEDLSKPPKRVKKAPKPLPRPKKRIAQKGKRTIAYEKWRDEVAKPYLDAMYGHVCAHYFCKETKNLHVDHIKNRGSHPDLKMELTNVQYLCFEHHRAKTDRLKKGGPM